MNYAVKHANFTKQMRGWDTRDMKVNTWAIWQNIMQEFFGGCGSAALDPAGELTALQEDA